MAVDRDKDTLIPWHVLRSTVANFAGQVITLGTGFLLTPFILTHLGATGYGLWVLVGSIAAYSYLLDLGITGAVVKYIAEYQARGDLEKTNSLIATTLWLYTAVGLLILALGALFAPFFPYLFNIPDSERTTAIWLVLITSVNMAISLPSTIPTSVLSGLQRFDLINILTTTGTLLVALATVIALLLGWGVLGMVAVTVPLTLLMQIPSIWLVKRVEPGLRYGWRGADLALARMVFSYSSSLFVSQISRRLQTKTDEIVIGAFLPLAAVTPYSLARRLSEIAQILTNQFMRVLLPLASELDADNDRERLRSLYITSTRLTLAIFLPIGGVLAILAAQVITVWVGAEYASYAYLVVILTLASLIDTAGWPGGSILQGMALHRPLAMMSLSAAVANLILSILLARTIGLVGVALGTLLPTTVIVFGFIQPYTMRSLGVGLGDIFKLIVVPVLGPAIPMLLVLVAMDQLMALTSLFPLLLTAGISTGVYVVVYLVWGASHYERQVYQGFARETLKTAKAQIRSS